LRISLGASESRPGRADQATSRLRLLNWPSADATNNRHEVGSSAASGLAGPGAQHNLARVTCANPAPQASEYHDSPFDADGTNGRLAPEDRGAAQSAYSAGLSIRLSTGVRELVSVQQRRGSRGQLPPGDRANSAKPSPLEPPSRRRCGAAHTRCGRQGTGLACKSAGIREAGVCSSREKGGVSALVVSTCS
jgi:hypothetical protein